MKRHFIGALWGLLFCVSVLSGAETRFKVKHDHGIGSCHGELVFGDTSVEYVTSHEKDARIWKYEDIQQLGLLSPRNISLLTYEDNKLEFGKDRAFNFQLTEGMVSASLWAYLQGKLTKPLVSEIIPADTATKYHIPVKHQHVFGGCQGILEIGNQVVIYRTSDKFHSRTWRYEDISSIGSTGPFQLRLSTMERTSGEYGSEKNFIFDLKRRLDPAAYDFIWWKLNGPQIVSGFDRWPD
jgi:hypothetical protein